MTDGNTEAARAGEPEKAGPQIKFGISLFELENDEVIAEVTGDPDMGQLQRLLSTALSNMNADITARKVVEAMVAQQAKSRIVRP